MNKFLHLAYFFAAIVGLTSTACYGVDGGQGAPSVANNSMIQAGIDGYVAPALLASGVDVSAQQNGTVIRSGRPNGKGDFFLYGLAPGNYDVVFTARNFATAVIANVPVANSTDIVPVSTTEAPIYLQPAIAVPHSINGSITLDPVSKTEAGYATVKQAFLFGPIITVKRQNADIRTGAYNIPNVPSVAPQLGQYTSKLPIVFEPQDNTIPGTGKYSVEASAPGYISQANRSVDVTLRDQFDIDFVLTP